MWFGVTQFLGMKGLEFPIIGTKTKGLKRKFDLSDIKDHKIYFNAKAGDEIKKIRKYLNRNTFMAFFLGKKNSGKGTYSGILKEIFGPDKIVALGVGDLVREVHAGWKKYIKTDEYRLLKKNYRGFISFDEAVRRLHGRTTTALLPTEFILALLKARIAQIGKKAILIDGLPRDLDQMSYSLYFRDLANYRDDPDFFIMIDIPMSVIDERLKYRVVCPKCKSSRSPKLLLTKDIRFNPKTDKFELYCDYPDCVGTKMLPREGDDLGIDPVRPRLEKDEIVLKRAFELHGMPKILLRNHVPAVDALKYYDEYELTPEYVLTQDSKTSKVLVGEKPWTIKDDNGVVSHSLLAPAVIVSLLKQLAEVL